MTNAQYIRGYHNFLTIHCNCYADDEGNRPCDNGSLCDRCLTEEAQEAWEKFKTHWAEMHGEG